MQYACYKKNFKEIVLYTAFTFILTWSVWLLTLSELNLKMSDSALITTGTFIPSIVGLCMEYKINGLKGLKESMKAMVNPKIGLRWYLYIFGLMPTTMLLSYIALRSVGSHVPESEFPFYAMPLVFIYILLLMGPLGEEAGWRGFLLRRMLLVCGPFYASIVIGFIWSLWHLPLFFLEGTIQQNLASSYSFIVAFGGYIFYTLMMTTQISILYIHTKGNVFGIILFHAVANTSLGMMPLILSTSGAIVLLIFMALITALLIYFNKKQIFV